MLPCREIAKLLDPYLDGELDKNRCATIEDHFRNCAFCNDLLNLRQQEQNLICASLPVPELAPDFPKQVMARLSSNPGRLQLLPFLEKITAKPWLVPALTGFLLLAFIYGASSLDSISPISKESTLQTQSTKDPLKNNKNQKPGEIQSFKTPEKGDKHELSDKERFLPSGGSEKSQSEEASYIIFTPAYLPVGFAFETITLLPQGRGEVAGLQETSGKTSGTQEPFLVSHFNSQTGARIYLEIIPIEPGKRLPAPVLEQKVQELGGENRITWYAQRGGLHFTLILSGDVSLQELKKVADSIH